MALSPRWTDASLDALRDVGDPPADAVIAELQRTHEFAAVNALMRHLVRNDDPIPEDLPPVVRTYLATEGERVIDPRFAPAIAKGQEVFRTFGPEMLLVLGCYSLPASYAAKKGVQVLARTGSLDSEPKRRVFETTQMVIDTMSLGGLDPGGKGVRTLQKVRLMHASIRSLVLATEADATDPWNRAWGVPINQEDLAGTLMTFSQLVLDGLAALDVALTDDEKLAYLETWCAMAPMLGIVPELVPTTLADARDLTAIIQRRQIAPSSQGVSLTRHLLEALAATVDHSWILTPMPAAMMRHLLPREVADFLQVPNQRWAQLYVWVFEAFARILSGFVHRDGRSRGLIGSLSRAMIAGMMLVERGGTRPSFAIPETLKDPWDLQLDRVFARRRPEGRS